MVETQIIISPVFLRPVLAGKGFDGRGAQVWKGSCAVQQLWGVFGWSEALGSGTCQERDPRRKRETRTSKYGSWACRIVLSRITCPFPLKRLRGRTGGTAEGFCPCCRPVRSYQKWRSQKLVSGFLSGDWGFLLIEWSTEHTLTPQHCRAFVGWFSHDRERPIVKNQSMNFTLTRDMCEGTRCLGPWTFWGTETWNKTAVNEDSKILLEAKSP